MLYEVITLNYSPKNFFILYKSKIKSSIVLIFFFYFNLFIVRLFIFKQGNCNVVITSYSIHYTKLYDTPQERPRPASHHHHAERAAGRKRLHHLAGWTSRESYLRGGDAQEEQILGLREHRRLRLPRNNFV